MSSGWNSFITMILDFLRSLGGSGGDTGPGEGGETPGGATAPGEERPGPEEEEEVREVVSPGEEREDDSRLERRQAMLQGKGLWAYRRNELDRAIQIAPRMGATHILYKVGQGARYYDEMDEVARAIRNAGLVPFAWMWLLLDDPQGEAQVVVRAFGDGFEGFVFDTEASQCSNRFDQAVQLGQYLQVAGVDPAVLYNCSFPNITSHRNLPYDQLNVFCKGGLMPMSYGSYFLPDDDHTPEQQAACVIDEWTYGQYEYWCRRWGYRPPLYPVLGPYHDEHGDVRMGPGEFQVWLDRLAAHGPSFFSVFTADVINDDLLPLILACPLGEGVVAYTPTGVQVEVVSPGVGYLNIRSSPSTGQPPIGRADHGEVLEALEPEADVKAKVGQDGQWLRIRTLAGIEGYVAAWYLSMPEEPEREEPERGEPEGPGVQVEVVSPAVGYLNVRPSPSTSQSPVTRADDGDLLETLEPEADVKAKVGQQGQWLHIRTPEGIEGYIAAWYVRLPAEPGGEGMVVGAEATCLVVHSGIGLNVRPDPSTAGSPIWHVVDRAVLGVIEDPTVAGGKIGTEGWIRVRTPSLHEGYVSGLYVRPKHTADVRKPVDDTLLPVGECAWIFGFHAAGATTPADFRSLFEGKGKTGWVLYTEAIGCGADQGGGDFSSWSNDGYGVIVRLNNGYEPAGTLPVRTGYADFARACASYVQNSRGCRIWIIGNEQNNVREHPGGSKNPIEHIFPEMYAEAFNLARRRIKAVDPDAIVVAGAVDPYNTYRWERANNLENRPLDYYKKMLDHIEDLDGIALHTYTHWLDVSLITDKKVFTDPPLDPGTPNEHYYDFQAYRPFIEAIPAKWRSRPVYLTESNHWVKLERAPHEGEQVEKGWINKDVGWIQAAYAEINRWNSTPHAQQIHCYLIYRWTGDEWAIEGLGEVKKDFKKALDHDYRWRR